MFLKNDIISIAIAFIFIIFSSLVHMDSAWAETLFEDLKLLPDEGSFNELFGNSTAVGNGVIAVGSYYDGDNGYASGSVFLFNSTTGAQIAKILPYDGAEIDQFAYCMAIHGGILVVGALSDDDLGTDSGSVYLFNAITGEFLSKLHGSDSNENDNFGVSVAIDNGIIAVGAYRNDGVNDSWSGAAYLFNADDGTEIAKLLPADGALEDFFGFSIDVNNNVVVVGSPWDDDNGNRSGSVYLFNATTGAQIRKILPDDGHTGDRFGRSVGIDNGVIVVGAYLDDDQGSNCGSAYLFNAATGAQTAKILPDDVYANDQFGLAVAIDAGVVIIGSKTNDGNGQNSGAAYLFDAATGAELDMLAPSDGFLADMFGSSVAINNGMISVGSVSDDDNGASSGSAYVFNIGGGSTPVMPENIAALTLLPNYPNPFNPRTTISYSLESDGQVELAVYSARGARVRTLVSEWQTSDASHTVIWDGKDSKGQAQSSGVYYARLESQGTAALLKMVLLK